MAEKQTEGELSFVSPGTTVEGKIKTDGNIRIDGRLLGELLAKSNVGVGLNGTVEGTLTAKNISVAGRVTGTITATEKLVLQGKSVVKGDIRASRLVVDEGAVFDGQCAMTPPATPGKPG